MGKGKNPTSSQHGRSPSGSHQHWGISIKKRNHVLGYNTQAAKKQKTKKTHFHCSLWIKGDATSTLAGASVFLLVEG